jgi:hypothetical protein
MQRLNEPEAGRGRVSQNLIILVAIILIVVAFVVLRRMHREPSPAPTPAPPTGGLSPFPELKEKPQPLNITFKGCPPEGDGGDPQLNRLKNRVDDATSYYPIPFDALVQLPWPKATERKDRANWSSADAEAVARYEGIPVSVEGYLAKSTLEGPESCNCHGADAELRDFHIWLIKNANDDRSNSIVVETGPRIRAKHPNWRTDVLGKIARSDQKVRISGWLMLDPEHPDQVGKTRGTVWEIHPIMQIHVDQQGVWVPLDGLPGK